MKNSFQTILIGICIAAFIAAILVFSGVIKIGSSNSSQATGGTISVWGTYPQDIVQGYMDQLAIQTPDLTIRYTERPSATLQDDIVRALADGVAPDLVMSDSNVLLSIQDRLYTIPFTTYSERLYRDSFIDGASVFLSNEGVVAVPLVVDPLVVYYNKDLLAGQNYVVPPTTWTGLVQSLPRFLKKDARGSITQTAIGLGEPDNVEHFTDILSALFLQTGTSVVTRNTTTGQYEQRLTIGNQQEGAELGSVTALTFFTNFVNQAHSTYSWSRTLPSTLDMFLSGRSAFYIGRASELFSIQQRNPNLNFDVSTLFQADGAVRSVTYGSFGGVALLKTSPQFPLAYSVLGMLTTPEFTQYFSTALSLPPTTRTLLLSQQSNPYVQVFFKAALSTFTWPDTNPVATKSIFRDMVRAVNSGRSSAQEAVYQASQDLQSAMR